MIENACIVKPCCVKKIHDDLCNIPDLTNKYIFFYRQSEEYDYPIELGKIEKLIVKEEEIYIIKTKEDLTQLLDMGYKFYK